MLEHASHGRVLQFGQFRLGHDAQRQHVHQHQQCQHPQKTDDRGFAHVRAFFGAPRINTGAFNADKHEHCHQHHVAHLVHHAAQAGGFGAPEVQGEDVGFKRDAGQHDKHYDRDDFRHGGDLVDKRRFLDAAQHQKVHTPQQQRGAANGDGRVALTEDRYEIPQRTEQQHKVADVAHPRADPVAPGRRKAHVIAKTGLGVGVDPGIEFRFAVSEGLEHKRQRQHPHRGNPPTNQDCPASGVFRNILRQRKNPAANHGTDHQGDQSIKPKLLGLLRHRHLVIGSGTVFDTRLIGYRCSLTKYMRRLNVYKHPAISPFFLIARFSIEA